MKLYECRHLSTDSVDNFSVLDFASISSFFILTREGSAHIPELILLIFLELGSFFLPPENLLEHEACQAKLVKKYHNNRQLIMNEGAGVVLTPAFFGFLFARLVPFRHRTNRGK